MEGCGRRLCDLTAAAVTLANSAAGCLSTARPLAVREVTPPLPPHPTSSLSPSPPCFQKRLTLGWNIETTTTGSKEGEEEVGGGGGK